MTNVDECRPIRSIHMEAGELAEPIAAYAAHLSGLGYAALTIKGYTDSARHLGVSVRCRRSDGPNPRLIVSTIDSGHLEALHGGQERSEEAVLR
ncbi:hypothetical protein ACEWPM_018245 [Roseovarius sp. S4756]|uniref:hypothetical protein n=1 Tax=Roseovarius maritimus TaxID=3342637 RepID=UPI00372C2BC8